ncbi:hypothetical protein LWI29_007328 [Acer saccharum]|uniref:Uncharacterized protein n=1 Tax=Acer saccharum TaxID=4024 RepID=A0AA39VB68_ACESA|nr:hypothetical protein LWI29_007328 [Acer saccharum]
MRESTIHEHCSLGTVHAVLFMQFCSHGTVPGYCSRNTGKRCTGVDLLDTRSTGSGAVVEELYQYMSRLAVSGQHRIPAPLGAPYIIFALYQTKVVK